jgi:hypothetical protein
MKIKYILTTWVPRVSAIIYILFIAFLSLDVFNLYGSFSEKIGGIIVENIPTAFIIFALSIAWEKAKKGGIIFIFASILFTLFFGTYHRWDTFALISVPLLIIGILFLLHKDEDN